MKITVRQLQQLGACDKQLALFAREWPDGAEVTLENARRAFDIPLDVEWFVSRTFSKPAFDAFMGAVEKAYAAYYQAIRNLLYMSELEMAAQRTLLDACAKAFLDAFALKEALLHE